MTRLIAQIRNPVLPGAIGGPGATGTQGGTALGRIISNMVAALFIFGFLAAFLLLITGAISWLTSGGDKGKLEAARDKIINAIVGLIILASVWAIIMIVGQLVGLDITNILIPQIGK
jgi:hypothetical protein